MNRVNSKLPFLIMLLVSYFIADLVGLHIRGYMIPHQAPPSRPQKMDIMAPIDASSYSSILARNIFNSTGKDPAPLVGQKDMGSDGEPVASQLPLGLSGTIVSSNPKKSIANIEIRPKNMVVALTPGRAIDSFGVLEKVERNKVIIRNSNNNRLEFIEMKTSTKVSFSGAKTGDVRTVGQGRFEISRSDVLKYTADMSKILMQASTIPRRKANGEIECFTLQAIQTDSIYTQLGLQNGDCIKSVNGEPVDSPQKAIQLYNALKNESNIRITVDRGGTDSDMEYSIK